MTFRITETNCDCSAETSAAPDASWLPDGAADAIAPGAPLAEGWADADPAEPALPDEPGDVAVALAAEVAAGWVAFAPEPAGAVDGVALGDAEAEAPHPAATRLTIMAAASSPRRLAEGRPAGLSLNGERSSNV
ncbi:MAG: hypothetical protein ACP5VP_05625 [Candidatus Limnocylindrales bacterium]